MSSRLVPRVFLHLAFACVLGTLVLLPGHVISQGPETFDLSFGVPTNRPIMATIESTIDGDISIESGDFQWGDALVGTDSAVIVDVHETMEKRKEVAVRYYSKLEGTLNGDIDDSDLHGVRARFTLEKGATDVTLLDNRGLTDPQLDTLLDHDKSLGFWLPLPKDATRGGKSTVNLSPMTGLLFHALDNETSSAELRITQRDDISTETTLEGDFSIEGAVKFFEAKMNILYKGDCTITVNPAQKRIVHMSLDGTFKFLSTETVTVTGVGDFKVEMNTELDDKKVKDANKRKPRFRIKRMKARRLGVSMRLPSDWAPLEMKSPDRGWVKTTDFKSGQATMLMEFIDYDSDNNPGYFFDKVYADLKSRNPEMKYKKIKSPLGGEGRLYAIDKRKSGGDDNDLFHIEIYPWRGKFLQMRLFGPPKAYKRAVKDFKAAKSSLRPFNPRD